MNTSDRPTLSVAETAELLGVSRWLVQQAVRDGSLPSRRIGRRILIPAARLDAWLQGDPLQDPSAARADDAPAAEPAPAPRTARVRAV
jgi:excisionase family DNA binding protein